VVSSYKIEVAKSEAKLIVFPPFP